MAHRKHHNEFVTVATFNSLPEAQRLKSWLESEDIPIEILDETRLQKYWFFVAPRAAFHVQAARDSFETALARLHEPKAAPLLKRAVRCPSCSSLRVQYPDLTRKNFLPTLVGQIFVMLHITQHKYYCEDCHFSWQKNTGRSPGRKYATRAP
jgi:hypothetical protein